MTDAILKADVIYEHTYQTACFLFSGEPSGASLFRGAFTVSIIILSQQHAGTARRPENEPDGLDDGFAQSQCGICR
jgi:hypothetical protein